MQGAIQSAILGLSLWATAARASPLPVADPETYQPQFHGSRDSCKYISCGSSHHMDPFVKYKCVANNGEHYFARTYLRECFGQTGRGNLVLKGMTGKDGYDLGERPCRYSPRAAIINCPRSPDKKEEVHAKIDLVPSYSLFSTGIVPTAHELVAQEGTNSPEGVDPAIIQRDEAGKVGITDDDETYKSFGDRAKEWTGNMWDTATTKIKSAWDYITSIGEGGLWSDTKKLPGKAWSGIKGKYNAVEDWVVDKADRLSGQAKKAFYHLTFQKDKAELLKLQMHHKEDSKRQKILELPQMDAESLEKAKKQYKKGGIDPAPLDADGLFYLPWDQRTRYEKENAGSVHTRVYLSIDDLDLKRLAKWEKQQRWEKYAEEVLENDRVRYHFILNDPDGMELGALTGDRLWSVGTQIKVSDMPRMSARDGLSWDLKGTNVSATEVLFMVELPGYELIDFDYDEGATSFNSIEFIADDLTPAELSRKVKNEEHWTISSTVDNRAKMLATTPELPHLVEPDSRAGTSIQRREFSKPDFDTEPITDPDSFPDNPFPDYPWPVTECREQPCVEVIGL